MKKKKSPDQTADMEQVFADALRAANPRDRFSEQKHRKIRIAALVTAVVVLAAAIACVSWWFFDYTKDDGRIYPNVYAYGVNLGGMTPEEAAAALHELTDNTYTVRNLTVELPDSTLVLSPGSTQAKLDVQKLVDLAFSYGREGGRWQNTKDREAAELSSHELDTLSCLTLDQAYIRDVVDQIAAVAQSSLTQTTAAVTGETPDLKMSYEKALEQTDVRHKVLTITMGTPDRCLDTEKLVQAILDAYAANDFATIVMDYDLVEPDPLDLQVLYTEHAIAPVDAVLNESDYTITDEILGYGFDIEAVQALMDTAKEGQVLTIDFQYLPAQVTKDSINATLFQDVLGSVSSSHSGESNRTTNLRLACQAIDGMILRPGETFSYNEALGERTEARGYKPASSYMGTQTVDTVGGGICQVSSSLYYACLKADLEIVRRTNHGYAVSYVPYGMDATVSWGTLDYKFRNNTKYPIRIQASVSGGQVHVQILGTDDRDYYVKVIYETVEGPIDGETVYKDFPYNNSEGYTDGEVIQTAYTGRTVKTYRCKYEKGTDELLSTEYEATSKYDSRDKIIARVAPKPTEPAPSEQADGQ